MALSSSAAEAELRRPGRTLDSVLGGRQWPRRIWDERGEGGAGGPREGIGNRRMWMFFFWPCGESEQTEMPLREQEQRQTRARMYIDVFTRSPRTHDNVIIVILLLLLFIIFQHCK